MKDGFIDFRPRHRVDEFIQHDGTITGISGTVLAETFINRGEKVRDWGLANFPTKPMP